MATFRHDDGPTASARRTGNNGWETLCAELLIKVWSTLPEDEIRMEQPSSTVRSVCHSWRAIHDAHLTRLRPSLEIDDATLRVLLDRFPALTTIELDRCSNVSDEGVKALGSLDTLTDLSLDRCYKVTDEGIKALGSLSKLTALNLSCLNGLTNEGVQAVCSLSTLTSLSLKYCSG
eukprot:9503094-Pyramimonas_sp.AAC.2